MCIIINESLTAKSPERKYLYMRYLGLRSYLLKNKPNRRCVKNHGCLLKKLTSTGATNKKNTKKRAGNSRNSIRRHADPTTDKKHIFPERENRAFAAFFISIFSYKFYLYIPLRERLQLLLLYVNGWAYLKPKAIFGSKKTDNERRERFEYAWEWKWWMCVLRRRSSGNLLFLRSVRRWKYCNSAKIRNCFRPNFQFRNRKEI